MATRTRRLKQSAYNRAHYQRNAESIRARKRIYMAERRAKAREESSIPTTYETAGA